MGLLDGFYSLASRTNKVTQDDTAEGVISDLLPELTLSLGDEELLALKRDWTKQWEPYAKEIEVLQKQNEDYWLGKQFNFGDGKKPVVDNLIFESLETFLPIATRPRPDPIVESDNSEEGNKVSDKVRKMLAHIADEQSLNLKMKQVARYWALYMLGCMKVGWSMKQNDITFVPIRPQKLILDPTATIESGEYTGYYIGEYLEDMASNLVLRFPNKQAFISDKVQGKMGTNVSYLLWSTDDYLFWTLDDEVLDKTKNPHWNYEQEQQGQMDEFGQQGASQQVPGHNHFKNRKKPYIFLSVFSLGKRPHDDTNLIQQNIPLQDLINKRLVQVDKNADNANGALALSGDAFTEEQAAKAGKAKRNGGTLWVPTGPVQSAVQELVGNPLAPFVYESLVDYRNELRNIFGTRGSTAQGTIQDRTVRGKMQIKGQDSDRIGGGVSVYLEEFADNLFNWCVQLMYVYYDEPHVASVIGSEKAKEYIQLSNKEMTTRLTVGVRDGSMIPHDPVAKREEAVQLWSEGALDPITLFDRLEFPNPRESAKNLFLWKADPIALFPELAQQMQNKSAAKPPTESINFKDIPPEAQAQMLAQAGIKVDPQVLAQHAAQEQQMAAQKAQQDMQLKQQGAQHQMSLKQQAHEHQLSLTAQQAQQQSAIQQQQAQQGLAVQSAQAQQGMGIKEAQAQQGMQSKQQQAQQKSAITAHSAHQSMSLKEKQAKQAAALQKQALKAKPKQHA